jgi:hypothetical protein
MSVAVPQQPRQPFAPWRFGLLLALLTVATYPQVVFGVQSFVARDFGFFVYPLALFQRQCFWHGTLPFWDPYNNCGVPMLAQWNTMPLYPPSLLYLTLPPGWSLSFFSLLHLWWAGFGMFFLVRRWTGNSFAAAFAGTVFAFNGFTLNLLMWPSHIATFSWMPWVVLTVEAAWREGGRKIPVAAFVGAMQMLAGGPETIFLTWLMLSALWLLEFCRKDARRGAMLWRFPLVAGLVFALSAVQLLPFLDLAAHAQRETGYTDLRWSMPGSGLANFLVPMAFGTTLLEGIFFQQGQYWTSSYYLGIAAVWLALLAFPLARSGASKGRMDEHGQHGPDVCAIPARIWLLGALAGLALLCALGDHTPFYPFLRRMIPQLSFITYPIKFVMVVVFAAPIMAAFALDKLDRVRKQLLPAGAVLLILIGGIIFWNRHAPVPGEDLRATLLNGLTRAAFLLAGGAILFGLSKAAGVSAKSERAPWRQFLPLGLILVSWLDVFTHEPRQNPTVPPGVFAPNLVRERLAMNPQPELGGSRAMLSPDAALTLTRFAVSDSANNLLAKRLGYCANINLLDSVPKVDGFFSLTPRDFDNLLSTIYAATNNDWSGVESFMGVSQYSSPTNMLAWQPRARFLPLITAGQKPFFLTDSNALSAMVASNFDAGAMVFLPPEEKQFVTATNRSTATIVSSHFENDTIEAAVQADAPSLVVIAQTYYHDWRAEVDGRETPLLRANLAFQAVQVPAGAHQVRLVYHDQAFDIGAAISACMWINCAVAFLAFHRREFSSAR